MKNILKLTYMEIIKTKEIEEYINRCYENLDLNYQNDFLDGYIEKEDEEEAKKELLQAGQREFLYDSPSLFISAAKFKNNPYYKNIKLDKIVSDNFSYEKTLIEKNYLFNYESIIDDEEKELKDYLKLRALDEDLEMIYLYEDNDSWMMCSPSEASTNDPYALKASGKVLTFGLGIGYFVYMALLNKDVKEITVIEKSKAVIDLFSSIYKQFPQDKKVTIINGDAFDYFNEEFLNNFDYIYVDIYKSADDGRYLINKLLEQYHPQDDKLDFWIDNSCLNPIRTLILMHYDELVHHLRKEVSEDYQELMDKVRYYFSEINIKISDVDALKNMMYDYKLIRSILGVKND